MAEHLEAIGLDVRDVAVGVCEFLVTHKEYLVVFEGLDDDGEVFHPGRYFFKHESVFNGEAVDEYVVDGERLQHPGLGGVVAKCFGVVDIILVLVVAFDTDAKHIFDGYF